MTHYKFLDVGCKLGGSFFCISKRFNYSPENGLGIDIDKKNVAEFIKSGNHAMVASAENIPFVDGCFELVIFNHVLEHMASEEIGFKALSECIRVSSKIVVIGLPFFDEDAYLRSLNLKTFYSDWSGHRNKVHLKKIEDYLTSLNIKYSVKLKKKIENSFSPEILPICAPRNSHEYDHNIHGIKEYIEFDRDIHREYQLIIEK
jgi:ubiquinone/menaquinone biosynthesis C-methylase UbiE